MIAFAILRTPIEEDTMADAAGIDLGGAPQLLHFARRLEVVAWRLTHEG